MVALGETILDQPAAAANTSARRDRRVGKESAVTTDYLWLGWQTMEERNPFGGSGSTDRPIGQYVWGQYIDECIQLTTLAVLGPQSLPAGAYYLFQDLLYRGVALTNSSGGIVETYDTDTYGNTLVFTAPDSTGNWWSDSAVQSAYGANTCIFQGREYDAAGQLYYYRLREYVPSLGRFTNRNPWGYIQGRYSLYDFAKDNPISYAEPTSVAIPVGIAIGEGIASLLTFLGIIGGGAAVGTAVRHLVPRPGRPANPPRACPGEPPSPCGELREEMPRAIVEAELYAAKTEAIAKEIEKRGGPNPFQGYDYAEAWAKELEALRRFRGVLDKMEAMGCPSVKVV